jgi:hypothetical protein
MREPMPARRRTWRQKVTIHDPDSGPHRFYVDFGEYPDGRLGEIFITAHKTGTFVRGVIDSLARGISVALQTGTSPHEMAKTLHEQDYPPKGYVEAVESTVTECTSIADYLAQEIMACYAENGQRKVAIRNGKGAYEKAQVSDCDNELGASI